MSNGSIGAHCELNSQCNGTRTVCNIRTQICACSFSMALSGSNCTELTANSAWAIGSVSASLTLYLLVLHYLLRVLFATKELSGSGTVSVPVLSCILSAVTMMAALLVKLANIFSGLDATLYEVLNNLFEALSACLALFGYSTVSMRWLTTVQATRLGSRSHSLLRRSRSLLCGLTALYFTLMSVLTLLMLLVHVDYYNLMIGLIMLGCFCIAILFQGGSRALMRLARSVALEDEAEAAAADRATSRKKRGVAQHARQAVSWLRGSASTAAVDLTAVNVAVEVAAAVESGHPTPHPTPLPPPPHRTDAPAAVVADAPAAAEAAAAEAAAAEAAAAEEAAAEAAAAEAAQPSEMTTAKVETGAAPDAAPNFAPDAETDAAVAVAGAAPARATFNTIDGLPLGMPRRTSGAKSNATSHKSVSTISRSARRQSSSAVSAGVPLIAQTATRVSLSLAAFLVGGLAWFLARSLMWYIGVEWVTVLIMHAGHTTGMYYLARYTDAYRALFSRANKSTAAKSTAAATRVKSISSGISSAHHGLDSSISSVGSGEASYSARASSDSRRETSPGRDTSRARRLRERLAACGRASRASQASQGACAAGPAASPPASPVPLDTHG